MPCNNDIARCFGHILEKNSFIQYGVLKAMPSRLHWPKPFAKRAPLTKTRSFAQSGPQNDCLGKAANQVFLAQALGLAHLLTHNSVGHGTSD